MKKLLFIFLLLPQLLYCQYKATNGITYNVGDTITIGKGTAIDDSFLYIQVTGLAMVSAVENGDDLNLDRNYSGIRTPIRKIQEKKIAGQPKTCFLIRLNPFNYLVYVGSALEAGEIK